jgi:hypothetical protein
MKLTHLEKIDRPKPCRLLGIIQQLQSARFFALTVNQPDQLRGYSSSSRKVYLLLYQPIARVTTRTIDSGLIVHGTIGQVYPVLGHVVIISCQPDGSSTRQLMYM